jgi:hypothetical protein
LISVILGLGLLFSEILIGVFNLTGGVLVGA